MIWEGGTFPPTESWLGVENLSVTEVSDGGDSGSTQPKGGTTNESVAPVGNRYGLGEVQN